MAPRKSRASTDAAVQAVTGDELKVFAKELCEDPRFECILRQARTTLLNQIGVTKPNETLERETLYFTMKAIDEVKGTINAIRRN